jgi:hypothetical protein
MSSFGRREKARDQQQSIRAVVKPRPRLAFFLLFTTAYRLLDALDLFFWVGLMMMMLLVDWNSESSFLHSQDLFALSAGNGSRN